MPALTDGLMAVPLKGPENTLSSVETRVVNPVPTPWPFLAGLSKDRVLVLPTSHSGISMNYVKLLEDWALTCPVEIVVRLMKKPLPDRVTLSQEVKEQEMMDANEAKILNEPTPKRTLLVYEASPTSKPCTKTGCACATMSLTPNALLYSHDHRGELSLRLTLNDPEVKDRLRSNCREWCPLPTRRCERPSDCCALYHQSTSSAPNAYCNGRCESWEFTCEHVGICITPMHAYAYEWLLSPTMRPLLTVGPPLPFEEWVARYPLKRREELTSARESTLRLMALTTQDARVKCFLKNETSSKMTDPRNISPRSDNFLSILGPAISAVEHRILDLSPEHTPLVKGLSLGARSDRMSSRLRGYSHYIETDYSRFDRSISKPMLVLQDIFLTASFPQSEYPLIHQALRLAQTTKGSSEYGIKYALEGTRCSGDAHTSIGNGLLNAFNTYVCLRHMPRDDWTSVHEGDDGIIGVRNGREEEAMWALTQLTVLGFDVKIAMYNQIEDASFCGRHFYVENAKIRDHADILRSLDKFHTSVSNGKDLPLVLAKARSYYHTDRHTPLIGPLTSSLVNALRGKVSFSAAKRALHREKKNRWVLNDENINVTDHCPEIDITVEARVSCLRRTGITIPQQLLLEGAYGEMARMQEILVVPRIPREWVTREDGYVHGNPGEYVRSR